MKKKAKNNSAVICPKKADLSKYSVVMAVYRKDKPEYLKEAIRSMLNQTYACEQFVIVMDGPVSRKSENVISDFKSAQPGLFTIIKLKENGGLGNALNCGIAACRNELIARMDSDDISYPDRCEKQIKEFQKNSRLSIVGTQIYEFESDKKNIVSARIVPADFEGIKKFARRRSPFNHMTVMYRKSVVLSFGGYASFYRKEDLELFVKMVHNGVYSINLDEILVLARAGNDHLKRRRNWMNCKEYIDIMYNFYKKGYLKTNDMLYVFFGTDSYVFTSSEFVRKHE